jgi:oligopeptidase B
VTASGGAPADAGAPVVARRPRARTVHGIELIDKYGWLRADNWREVLRDPALLPAEIRAVLDAENAYAAALLADTEPLQATLLAEMRGRIKEDDSEVPLADGPWLYYARYRAGGQQPLHCRRPRGADEGQIDGEETILLDGDALAKDESYFDIGAVRHAPDHAHLGWSADTKGSEFYAIAVRDIASGADLPDRIEQTDGSLVWMADSRGFYYVRVDENHRSTEVYRHRLGTAQADDVLVFAERDPAWFINIGRSQSGAFAVVRVSDHDSAECHLIDLHDPQARPLLVAPRARGIRYEVADQGDRLLIRTNADGAEDFKIAVAPLATPDVAHWHDLVPHRRGRMIVAMMALKHHLVWLEREDGRPRLAARTAAGAEIAIDFAEEAYQLGLERSLEYDTATLRFSYSSMTTPREVYDQDLNTGTRVLRKRQQIPSGHDPSRYVTRRLFATAPDGAQVPLSIVHRADLAIDGARPVLLYGYGAYGHPMPASFSANRLSLVDRGFVYAIAHIRGGTDKGWHWYLDGKLAKKPNSFSDFIACARHLVAAGYTAPGRIVAHGGSAGGMLMGAVLNLAPELFAGVIADVPFVDVLNTMLDAELPLTPPEWLEWGNPIADPAAFETIRLYAPYENVKPGAYPPVLALAGLTDPRVTYWEPAKWIARLRAAVTAGGPVLLKTNTGAGHGGASGRFDRLQEVALHYAFALACVEGRFERVRPSAR